MMGFWNRPSAALDMSSITTSLPHVVNFEVDMGTITDDVPLYIDGDQAMSLHYVAELDRHCATVFANPGTAMTAEFTDSFGDLRTDTISTASIPTPPTVTRTRYVSPDVSPGGGDYSSGNPGNLDDALNADDGDKQAGDEYILYQGTKPYYLGNYSVNSAFSPFTMKAATGESPVWSGAREGVISWSNDGNNIYSTTDYDAGTVQVHALISGKIQRIPWFSSLAKLQSETDTCQAATANTITLGTSASTVDGYYDFMLLEMTTGAAAGEKKIVGYKYDGSTGPTPVRIAEVAPWTTQPSAGDGYKVSAVCGWTISGGRLHIKLSTNPVDHAPLDPSTTTVYLPRTDATGGIACTFFGDDTWIEGITFEFFGDDGFAKGITIGTLERMTVKDCTFRSIKQIGINCTGSSDVYMTGNTLEDYQDYMSFHHIKNSGTNKSEAATQIYVNGCQRVTITGTTAIGLMDPIAVKGAAAESQHVIIYDNTILQGRGETIDIGGSVSTERLVPHTIVVNNSVQSHHAIAMATVTKGPVRLVNNKYYDQQYLGPVDLAAAVFEFGNTATKFNSGATATVGHLYAVHNTIAQHVGDTIVYSRTQCWSTATGYPMSDAYARNNLFSTYGRPFRDLSDHADSVYDFDHNQWWTTNDYGYGGDLWTWNSTGGTAADFSAFQILSGQESNGVFADPVFGSNWEPTTPTTGIHIPGITGNSITGVTSAQRGAQ